MCTGNDRLSFHNVNKECELLCDTVRYPRTSGREISLLQKKQSGRKVTRRVAALSAKTGVDEL